jgi:hypothetical protein
MPARKLNSPRVQRLPRQIVLRATMREINPTIWRSLRVPDGFTLARLHRVLQVLFSRLDYHLYEFEMGDRRFQAPDPEAEEEFEDATRITLADLRLETGSQLLYRYDFGDDWEHDLVVERFLPMPPANGPDWTPRVLDGARAAPPEDAGGPHGYELFLAALNDPNHPEHEEYRQWVGPHYQPDSFDAWALDHSLALAIAWDAI